jgi:hypothetical protein
MSKQDDMPVMTKSQFDVGVQMMQRYLKRVEVKVEGTEVHIINVLDLKDSNLARVFAQQYATLMQGGAEDGK